MSRSKRDTEVVAKARRRRFSAAEKLRILREADGCTARGELGALLRREGLYSSQIADWRRARERGELTGLSPRRRGPEPKKKDARDKRITTLEREIRKLRSKLERAEGLIAVQKNYRGAEHHPVGTETLFDRIVSIDRGEQPKTFWWFDPVKKHGPGTVADLRLVTCLHDPV